MTSPSTSKSITTTSLNASHSATVARRLAVDCGDALVTFDGWMEFASGVTQRWRNLFLKILSVILDAIRRWSYGCKIRYPLRLCFYVKIISKTYLEHRFVSDIFRATPCYRVKRTYSVQIARTSEGKQLSFSVCFRSSPGRPIIFADSAPVSLASEMKTTTAEI